MERLFKRSPFLFAVLIIVLTSIVTSVFQGVEKDMADTLMQYGLCGSNGTCIWLVRILVVMILIIPSTIADFFYRAKNKKANIEWDVVNDKYARVCFYSHESNILFNCTGELEEGKIYFDGYRNSFSPTQIYFSWSNERPRIGDKTSINIQKEQPAWLDIATVKNEELHFAFIRSVKPRIEPGLYYLSIRICGTKNDSRFENDPIDFVLDFQGKAVEIKKMERKSRRTKRAADKWYAPPK